MELGVAGATVYVTGRSTRKEPANTYGELLSLSGLPAVPGNIDETADDVTRGGGRGVPIRCDHTQEKEVAELFARVQRDEGRLDMLVNNAWGGHESFDGEFDAPFWEHPLAQWDAMFDRGVRNHLVASRFAAPIMVSQDAGSSSPPRSGTAIDTCAATFHDLAKAAMNRWLSAWRRNCARTA